MYNSQEIANRIKIIAKQRNVSVSTMLSECDLGKNTISKMSAGADIQTLNFAKIADYLDASVDYLLGRETDIKKAAESDEQIQQLYDIFNNLNSNGRDKLLEYAAMMESSGMFSVNVLPFAARTTNDTIELVTDINNTEVPPPDTI